MTGDTDAIRIRPALWPQDEESLAGLDTSFVTETVYRPILDGLSFRLVEEAADPPRRKAYAFRPEDSDERRDWGIALVAEADGRLVCFAAAKLAAWNRRLEIQHLYVGPAHRGIGVGRRLLDALDDHAWTVGARCLWLETQNVNVSAVRFYQRVGFRFCGFDSGLYDPVAVPPDEIALFFDRAVAAEAIVRDGRGVTDGVHQR